MLIMSLEIGHGLLHQIHAHLEAAYPEEGAGLLLGEADGRARRATAILRLPNTRQDLVRRNRYMITPQDYLQAEQEAARRGLQVLGVYHSHPDHPSRPSEYDREWAMPWFVYLITSVRVGGAADSRCWRLSEDRSGFEEEPIEFAVDHIELNPEDRS